MSKITLIAGDDTKDLNEIVIGIVGKEEGWIVFRQNDSQFFQVTRTLLEEEDDNASQWRLPDLEKLAEYIPLRKWIIISNKPDKDMVKYIQKLGGLVEKLVLIHVGFVADYLDVGMLPNQLFQACDNSAQQTEKAGTYYYKTAKMVIGTMCDAQTIARHVLDN